MKYLTKSRKKVISGICGGIAEYINPTLDPVVIRIVWAVCTVFNPLMILAYIVLHCVIPNK